MTAGMLLAALATAATGATPLLLAAIGETVTERSGVLNLGLEGTMLVSAFAAFATEIGTGSHVLAVLAGGAAGVALSVLFAVLALGLAANQVASGLAVTIFGSGLSSLLGARFVGRTARPLPHLHVPVLSDIPLLGPLLFRYHALVYVSVAATGLVAWALGRTRAGLVLRAAGEDADSAHALGHDVLLVRCAALLFGGMMSGLAGACLSLAETPMWMEGLSAGRGWIALALVVFGAWRPWRVLAGAYLFGGISVLQLYLQGSGFVAVPTQMLAMIPYLATILVLSAMSTGKGARRLQAPACLGKPFDVAR